MKQTRKLTLLKLLAALLLFPLYLFGTVTSSDGGTYTGNNHTRYVENITITIDEGANEEINLVGHAKNFDRVLHTITQREAHLFNVPAAPNNFASVVNSGLVSKLVLHNPQITNGSNTQTFTFEWDTKYFYTHNITGNSSSRSSVNTGTITVIVNKPVTAPTADDFSLTIDERTNHVFDISSHIHKGTYDIDHIAFSTASTVFHENHNGDYAQLYITAPDVTANQNYNKDYTVYDQNGNVSATGTITLHVKVQTPPKTKNLSLYYTENSGIKYLNLPMYAIKTEGDPISNISVSSGHSFITQQGTKLRVDTNAAPIGTYTVTWLAEDNDGWSSLSDPRTITIHISAAAIVKPTANAINKTVDEGRSISFNLHSASYMSQGTYPLDSIELQNPYSFMTLSNATVTPGSTNTLTFSPPADSVSNNTTYGSAKWRVCDNQSPKNCSAWKQITVTVNNKIEAHDSTVIRPTNHNLYIGTNWYIKKGAHDISSVTLLSKPAWIDINPANHVIYATPQPAPNAPGNYPVTWKVCDTAGLCDTATMTIRLVAGTPPTAHDKTIHWTRDTGDHYYYLSWITTHDSDTVTYTNISIDKPWVSQSNYKVKTDTDGRTAGDTAHVRWKACDVDGCSTATLTVIIDDDSNPPIMHSNANIGRNVRVKHPQTVDLSNYVSATGGDSITYSIEGLPSFVTLAGSTVTINPTSPSQIGNYGIPGTTKWCATDNDGKVCRNFFVRVYGQVPDAYDKSTGAQKGNHFGVTLIDLHAIELTDGDPIDRNYRIKMASGESKPSWLHFNRNKNNKGHIYGLAGDAGVYHIKFKAHDIDGWSEWKTLTLTVLDGTVPNTRDVSLNQPVLVAMQDWYLDDSRGQGGGVSKTESNPILSYHITGTVPPGLHVDTAQGRIYGTPTVAGDYNLTFDATDVNGLSAPAIFTIHVVAGAVPQTASGFDLGILNHEYDCELIGNGDPCGTGSHIASITTNSHYPITDINYSTLPSGVELRSNGVIIMNASAVVEGNQTITFQAQNAIGWSNPATFTLNVPGNPPIIDVPDVNFTIGRSAPLNIDLSTYTTLTHHDPILGYSWLSGTLPAGMSWSGGALNNTLYEDAEDGNTAGWVIYDSTPAGASIANVYDSSLHSHVITLHGQRVPGSSNSNGFRLLLNNNTQKILSWRMKTNNAFIIYIRVTTTSRVRYISYYVGHGLGNESRDGNWHTYTKDLNAYLHTYHPDEDIVTIDDFRVRTSYDVSVDNIMLSSPSTGASGVFSGSPTHEGNFSIGVGATDDDGMGTDTFTINVLQPTVPNVHDRHLSVDEGSSVNYNLFSHGAVVPTDGDAISSYEVNASTPLPAGISFDTTTGTFTGTPTAPGTYDVKFRATDIDGPSDWATFQLNIHAVLASNGLCFEPLSSFSYVGPCNLDPLLQGEYRGGLGCKQTILIDNISNQDLYDVALAIDHTSPYDVNYVDYGIDHTSKGGSAQSRFTWGSHDFNKGTKFNMVSFDSGDSRSIYTRKGTPLEGVIPDLTTPKPVFNGNNLYAKYRDANNSLHIAKVLKCLGGNYDKDMDVDSDFHLIYGGPGNAVLGDMAATGDAILYVNDPNTDNYGGSLSSSTSHYVVSDANFTTNTTDTRKKNASSATLNLPGIVRGEHIKWAGLFWQGYVHTPSLTPANVTTMMTDVTGWNQVTLKTPDNTMHAISAPLGTHDANSSTYHYGVVDNNSSRFFYSAYVDVTSLVKSTYSSTNNTFTVGNIMTTQGKDFADTLYVSHANNGTGQWNPENTTVGYFGGWSLVVVYDLIGTPEAYDTSNNEVYKNISLYNGYDFFMTWGDGDVSFEKTISLSGFRTPGSGTVDSNMLFFGGGADQNENGDKLEIQRKKTSLFDSIFNASNPTGEQFNSTYTKHNTPMNVSKAYRHAMDLDMYDVSSSMDYNQSSTKIKFGTKKIGDNPLIPNAGHSDQIFPQVVGLSTKLYVPEICYDFDVKIGDVIRVDTSDERVFSASSVSNYPLNVKILLKSEQADFDLIHSQGKVDFNSSVPLDFNASQSKVSPPSLNAYIPAIHTQGDYISVGENNSITGGTIEPNKLNYAKFAFDFTNGNSFTTRFDIDLNTSIQFDAGSAPLPYILTSKGDATTFGHISRCERNRVYDPVLGQFNIEKGSVTHYHNDQDTYPLDTQITGRDYSVTIASYTDDGSNHFNVPTNSNAVVELEVIDAGSFDNNASTGFDSICMDPSAAIGEGKLFKFNNTSRTRSLSMMTDMPDYDSHFALQNAAFRVWVLTKKDANASTRTIVEHGETDKNNFAHVYNTYYGNAEDNATHYCRYDCGIGNQDTSCYDCLKEHFSVPVCSRDNFSIRPESYRIQIGDTLETNTSTGMRKIVQNNTTTTTKLAAGYKYWVDINATLAGVSSGVAKGYYREFDPDTFDAQLEFTGSSSNCNDTNNTGLSLSMLNGKVSGIFKLVHNNAGNYDMWMQDQNWTKVDQGTFAYKKHFSNNCRSHPTLASCSECIVDNSQTSVVGAQVGCTISSSPSSGATQVYKKLPLTFEPYSFNVSNIALEYRPSNNGYLFINDFDDPYYNDLLVHPVDMGAVFKGNITAVGKNGTVLSNFVDGCSASDVRLNIIRDTNPIESTLDVSMQQYLQYGPASTDFNVTENGPDANITLPKAAFTKASAGSADNVHVYTNFKKPTKHDLDLIPGTPEGINPIAVEYKDFKATGDYASSNADKLANHIPGDTKTYDSNTTFVYGKISPKKRLYETDENATLTPIFVDVYCDLGIALCQSKYDLNITTHTQDESVSWYLESMFANNELGDTTLSVSTYRGHDAHPGVSTDSITRATTIYNVPFDDDTAAQNDVNVSVTGASRPSIVKVQYQPVPWLIYDPANDYYRVKFIGISDWSGVGKSGFVSDMNSSHETTQRMNW